MIGTKVSLEELGQILGVAPEQARVTLERARNLKKLPSSKLPPVEVKRLLEASGFVYPQRNIVFHCLKGGAAKTTLAYNAAYRLSQLGARVLLVDLDKQGNATQSLGLKRPAHVFVDLVTGKATAGQAIVPVRDFLDLLPSSLENARLEMELINRKCNPKNFYRALLSNVRDRYDMVLLDLPPDLSHNTYLSSLFADTICIPTTPDEYSVQGTRMTLSSLEGIQKEYPDHSPDILIVWTKYDAREKGAMQYLAEIRECDWYRVFPEVIRTDVTYKTAQSKSLSIFELPKRSNAREDIDVFAQELLGLRDFFSAQRGEA